MLVHGYCAGANEFPLADFTNAVHFQDFKQKRSNDEFALLIQEFAKDIPSFSLVCIVVMKAAGAIQCRSTNMSKLDRWVTPKVAWRYFTCIPITGQALRTLLMVVSFSQWAHLTSAVAWLVVWLTLEISLGVRILFILAILLHT